MYKKQRFCIYDSVQVTHHSQLFGYIATILLISNRIWAGAKLPCLKEGGEVGCTERISIAQSLEGGLIPFGWD